MKKLGLLFITILLLQTAKSQVVFTCDFEDEDSRNWILMCYSLFNDLYVGNATNHGGQYSMYISSDNGATNNYYFAAYERATLRRKTITLDAGYYLLSVDCNVNGFYNNSRFHSSMSIFLLPGTVSTCNFDNGYYSRPSNAIFLQGLHRLYRTDGWQTITAPISIRDSGDYKLVIMWEASGRSYQPIYPTDQRMAVDNIVIEKRELMPVRLRVTPSSSSLGSVTGGGWYSPGDEATVTAMPKSGNAFLGWSDNATANPRRMVVNSDSSIVATFAAMDTSGSVIVYMHDTIPFYLDTFTYVDTLLYNDTLQVYDTITIYDTVAVYDTITATVYDSVTLYDTVLVYDTVRVTVYDTVTVTVYDTVQVGMETVGDVQRPWVIAAEDGYISVRGAEGETVRVFDALGRQLHVQPQMSAAVRFRMPSTGVYFVKVGRWPAYRVVIKQ